MTRMPPLQQRLELYFLVFNKGFIITLLWLDFSNSLLLSWDEYIPANGTRYSYPVSYNRIFGFFFTGISQNSAHLMWTIVLRNYDNFKYSNTSFTVICHNSADNKAYGRPMKAFFIGC